jgi:hypothetical protein
MRVTGTFREEEWVREDELLHRKEENVRQKKMGKGDE